MRKNFIICLCLIALFITGCGCSKKDENLKTLTCRYKDETINEEFTIYFKDGISTSFDSEQIYLFASNEQAQIESSYFMNYDSIEVKENSVIVKRHYDYTDDEQITYDEIVGFYSTYECE